MPIGEDVPMLIPISIVLTIFLLFLLSIFINFAERNEVIRMSETALDIGDISANIIFADSLGRIDEDKLKALGTLRNCEDISELNLTVNYQVRINASKVNSNEWWCWDNTNSFSKEPKTFVKKTIPIMIDDNDFSEPGKVDVTIGK